MLPGGAGEAVIARVMGSIFGAIPMGPGTIIGMSLPPGTYIGPLASVGAVPPVKPVKPLQAEEDVPGGNLGELLEKLRREDKKRPPGTPWREPR